MTPGTRHVDSLLLASSSFTNPRSMAGLERGPEVRELAVTIANHGLLVPLIINVNGIVIAGQRRTLAIRLLAEWHRAVRHGEPHELDECEPDEVAERRARWLARIPDLVGAVPVIVVGPDADIEAIALADNLQRTPMTAYEVAARLAHLHEGGATGANLARATGKSRSWVSRKLKAWQGACAELREAWKGGMSEDAVLDLVELTPDQQRKELARGPRPVRGPAGRPPIATIKAVLADLERVGADADPRHHEYVNGVRDALRWVAGQPASEKFLRTINTALTD